jgi:hypothetical protein
MIHPKLLMAGGAVLAVVLVIGAALWQANKLVRIGQDNAELRQRLEECQTKMAEDAASVREVIAMLEEDIAICNQRVIEANALGSEWERRYRELASRPPVRVEVPVEIEATECVEALAEAQLEVAPAVAAALEEVSHG